MVESKKDVKGPTSSREMGDWPIFPVEIFEVILQQVAWGDEDFDDDKPTLESYMDEDEAPTHSEIKNLSLVCWTFARLCRPYIWKSIKIAFNYGGPRPSLRKLSNLFKKSPALATYVNRVSCSFESTIEKAKLVPGLSVLFELPNVKEFAIPEEASGENEWTLYYGQDDKNLAWRSILDHFMTRNLSKVTISNMLDPPIIQLLSSPALESLELKTCTMTEPTVLSHNKVGPNGFNLKRFIGSDLRDFPISVLSCCPQLEDLDLVSVHPPEYEPSAFLLSTSISPFRRLRKLRTQGFFECSLLCGLADIAGLDHFPALQDLSITVLDAQEIPGVLRLLKYCRSLEKIYIQNSRNVSMLDPTPLRQFILASKATLKDLWLDYGVESLDEAEKATKELCDTLEHLRGQNVLEELTTGTDFQCLDSELLQPRSVKEWQRLDKLLLANDGADFSHLREVVICLEPFVHPTGRFGHVADAKLKTFLKEPLKGLFATKRFTFMSAINLHKMGKVQYGI